MSDDKPHNKKDNDSFEAINEAFNRTLPESLKKQMNKSLDGFRQDLKGHPYVRKLKRHGVSNKKRILTDFRNLFRPLLLAGAGLVCVVALTIFFIGDNPPTWAEVSESLESVSNLSAVMYVSDETSFFERKKVEFWLGYGDRIRILSDNKVSFGKRNDIIRTFDLETRSECYPPGPGGICPHADAFNILRRFNKMEGKPITVTIESLSGTGYIDVISLVHINPKISNDLVVFEVEANYVRGRIWALRESRLPIRMSAWTPSGLGYDMLITYPKEEQPEVFFDPDAFKAVLKEKSKSQIDLMYMFFRMPGIKSIPASEN
jgi:outer membrane lipoprotein-sorting protein